MREIKFDVLAVSDTDNNITRYGVERLNEDGNWEYMRSGRDSYLLGTISDNQGNIKFIRRQFTGLHDKNGKEIYEGDIVKFHRFVQELGDGLGITEGEREIICEISFCESGVMLDDVPFFSVGGIHEESFEVIGNIYENRYLLEKQ